MIEKTPSFAQQGMIIITGDNQVFLCNGAIRDRDCQHDTLKQLLGQRVDSLCQKWSGLFQTEISTSSKIYSLNLKNCVAFGWKNPLSFSEKSMSLEKSPKKEKQIRLYRYEN